MVSSTKREKFGGVSGLGNEDSSILDMNLDMTMIYSRWRRVTVAGMEVKRD